jgi:hypothetical protein
MPRPHPAFRVASHRGCVVCAQFHAVQAVLHASNLRKMRRVAASLRASGADLRESGQTKQETPNFRELRASTAPAVHADRRAADAKSGTGSGQK